MMTVHPIQPSQLEQFIHIGSDTGHCDDTRRYLEQMLAAGSIRTEWCYVVEENDHMLGRVAFWSLPKSRTPQAIVLLDLPWEKSSYMSVGTALLQRCFADMRDLGTANAEYVLDGPAMAPQWQNNAEERIKLLEHVGFRLLRKTYRFEYKHQELPLALEKDCIFKSLQETGEAAFIEAIERVGINILDQREQDEQHRLGHAAHALDLFRDLQQMDVESHWWQLAYTPEGNLIGLVMPAKNPTYATIAYIGVVPEQRGKGYIDVLLDRGTRTLFESGANIIRADTDLNNFPMANAFIRYGYEQFAIRHEYRCLLD
ncbi:hypothetical protein SD71_20220 [Cohnella kolymensis]|uniref:N-acetyltransferase domain-containing protein n=1 Tax=Cohnella kolymensis TaxID=1590652 RepID=A0ABR4ZZW5_9BACL|nr:GNAT family N-acetyltransferase [Cohnella kolymensis]KIL34359.1 hypothetical protein SD71_20220 [Cohnella kolymensis]